MLFSIVIPAFNAAERIHVPLLSLSTQIFKDFEVIIVDDCSTEEWISKIEPFKRFLNIRVIKNDSNKGCGETLQAGLDACKGDYFISLDDDDQLATPETLMHFARLIQQHKEPDAIVTAFMEYDPDTGRMTLIDQNNSAFIHGKAFKVEFCRDNNVTFPSQKWFEDGAFNFIALNITKNIVRDTAVTYLWQSNKNSITRSRDYNFEVMPYYCAAYTRAYPILQDKDARQANFFSSGLLGYGYYYYMAFEKRRNTLDLKRFIDILRKCFDEMEVIDNMNNDKGVFEEYCRNDSRMKTMIESQEGPLIITSTINDWLKKHFDKKIKWLEVQKNA